MNATDLSDEEKRMSLNYGVIKGRGCADGRKQRAFIEKEQASSPTVSLEALLLTCVIDALEKTLYSHNRYPRSHSPTIC
jgi:hypothetical protein